MVIELIVVAAAFAGGFGCGRIKNKAKLSAVQSEANKLRAAAEAQLKKL